VEAPTAGASAELASTAERVSTAKRASTAERAPTAERVSTAELDRAAETAISAEAAAIVAAIDDIPAGLDDSQRAILDFERQWWKRAGAKEQAIRDTFAMSPTRYYQTLNTLLELPGAIRYDPTLVHRLQRLRSSALRSRRLG
jgi:Protein of unknown function (DUF3263)